MQEQLPRDEVQDVQVSREHMDVRSDRNGRKAGLGHVRSDWSCTEKYLNPHSVSPFGDCKKCDQAHSFHGNNTGKVFTESNEFGAFWRSKMKRNQKIRGAILVVVMLVSVVLSMAQAHDYNDGLLAARAGDYNTAVMKWQPLALQGDAMAQFNLALMYHRGLGVGIDETTAVSWYKMSAENGYIKAQEFLAAAYKEGWFGLPNDQEKATYWLQRMAEQSL